MKYHIKFCAGIYLQILTTSLAVLPIDLSSDCTYPSAIFCSCANWSLDNFKGSIQGGMMFKKVFWNLLVPSVKAQYKLLSKFLAIFCFSSLKAGSMNYCTCYSCKKSSVSFFSMPCNIEKWMNASILNEAPSTIDYTKIGSYAIELTYNIRGCEELTKEFKVD